MKVFAIISIVVSAISCLCEIVTLSKKRESNLFFAGFALATSICLLCMC